MYYLIFKEIQIYFEIVKSTFELNFMNNIVQCKFMLQLKQLFQMTQKLFYISITFFLHPMTFIMEINSMHY